VDFLIGATWLALHVWASEHLVLLAATATCAGQPVVRGLTRV
jgi:hypothetical protein